jgi:1-acyl-sn-glycerol-3-phosphate acyltransferase
VNVVRDWVTTIPTLLGIGITLGVFDVVGRVALLFGLRPFEWTMVVMQRVLLACLRISGIKVHIEGRENIEPRRGYLIVSNHQSMFDIPIFGGTLMRNFPKYIAKASLGSGIPAVSLNLQRGGNALIERDDRGQATEAIRRVGVEAERRGVAAVIFPEGSRSRDGSLGDFRPAGTAALLEGAPCLPIVPAAIDGSWTVLRNNLRPIPFGTTVRVRFGLPMPRDPAESATRVLEDCRDSISAALEDWRSRAPAA